MTVRYTERAIADLEAIADYLVQRSPQGARNVRTAIERTMPNLNSSPALGGGRLPPVFASWW